MIKQLYAAYGSNLNIQQMKYRCPTAKPIAKSWLFDHRLVFKGRLHGAHATVIPEEGQAVPLVIWEVNERDEAALDRYEGVAGGYYTKEYVEVEVAGEMRKVLIYIMRPCDYGLPTRQYLDIVTRGYVDFNLPTTTLEDAVGYSYDNAYVYKNHKEEVKHGN